MNTSEGKYCLLFWSELENTEEMRVVFGTFNEDNKTVTEFTFMGEESSAEYVGELDFNHLGVAIAEFDETEDEEGEAIVSFKMDLVYTMSATDEDGNHLTPRGIVTKVSDAFEGDFSFMLEGMRHVLNPH